MIFGFYVLQNFGYARLSLIGGAVNDSARCRQGMQGPQDWTQKNGQLITILIFVIHIDAKEWMKRTAEYYLWMKQAWRHFHQNKVEEIDPAFFRDLASLSSCLFDICCRTVFTRRSS